MIRNISIDPPSAIISSKNIKMNQKQKKKRTPVFPQRLYDMLEDADEEGYSHLLGWSPDGMSFRMFYDAKNKSNNKCFVEVLKRKFNQTQFKSFLRQLQLYGFERQCKGSRKGECKHPLFQRGQQQLFQNKSIEEFQEATQTALTDRITANCRTLLLCPSLFPLRVPSVLPSVTLSSSAKEEEQDSFPLPSSTLSSSSLLNHCLAPHYNYAPSTSTSISTNVDTTNSYCTDGATTSITSKFNYLAMSTIPTKLTNLVRSNDNHNNQDNDDDNDDDDDDDATAESNGSDNNSLDSNKVFNRTFVGTDADTVPISRKSKVLLMCPLIWNDTCDDYDKDCECDDDVDMQDENMTSVDNGNDNDVQQQQQQQL